MHAIVDNVWKSVWNEYENICNFFFFITKAYPQFITNRFVRVVFCIPNTKGSTAYIQMFVTLHDKSETLTR